MAAILFRQAAAGHRMTRGDLILSFQQGLQRAGQGPGAADGIFGGQTAKAYAAWRQAQDDPLPPQERQRAAVRSNDWSALTGLPAPSDFQLCLQVTADFEGHGFSKVAGAFDAGWLTWGIVGFTLAHGSLVKLLQRIAAEPGDLLGGCFDPESRAQLLAVIEGDQARMRSFAVAISNPDNTYEVIEPWRSGFERLGQYPQVQAHQLALAQEIYWHRALADVQRFGLEGLLGHGLALDIAVQNGGIGVGRETRQIQRSLDSQASQEDRRRVIAEVVAENSSPRWQQKVLSRKATFVTGLGQVNGSDYDLGDWGLTG